MRLIDADKLIARYCEENCGIPRQECERIYECDACSLVKEIESEPAVDAELVRHGHWIPTRHYMYSTKCSVCGKVWGTESPHCPSCGAKMNGGSYG